MILSGIRERVFNNISLLCFLVLLFFLLSCTSGSDLGQRNNTYFEEAGRLHYTEFTSTPSTISGSIQGLVADINALGVNTEQAYAGANANIRGVVTIPGNYGIAIGTTNSGCDTTDTIYQRSFVLQDANAGILIAYGKEPPSQNTTDSGSAHYIANARNLNLAIMGDVINLTVTKVQKYGSGANTTPIVTDFTVSSVSIASSRNSIPYVSQALAFTRASDFLKVRRLEGYVKTSPPFKDCLSGTGRQFQFNFQLGYVGEICVGAPNATVASTCPNPHVLFKFQMSKNLGSGTLSGFDTDNSFSYTIPVGAKVRMTGPVFPPQFNQADSELMLMLDQRAQVESIP